MNEQMQQSMTIEDLTNMVTEMKLRTCDFYRTVDMYKAQLQQSENQLNEQLQQLSQAEQELQKMQQEVANSSKDE